MDVRLFATAAAIVFAGLFHAWLWHRRLSMVGLALITLLAIAAIGGTVQLLQYVKAGGSEADAYPRLVGLLMLFLALPAAAYLASLAVGTALLKAWRGLFP